MVYFGNTAKGSIKTCYQLPEGRVRGVPGGCVWMVCGAPSHFAKFVMVVIKIDYFTNVSHEF